MGAGLRALVAVVLLLVTATPAFADAGWRPPEGWTVQNAAGTPMIVIWTGLRSGDFTPNINVLWDTAHGVDAEWAATSDALRATGVAVTSRSVACAAGRGVRFEYDLTIGARSLAIVSYLAPDGSGGAYIATYTRLAATAAEPQVLAALAGICEVRPVADPPRRDMALR